MYKSILFFITFLIPSLTLSKTSDASLQTKGYCSPVIEHSEKVRVVCGLPAPLVRKMIKSHFQATRGEVRKLKRDIASIRRLLKKSLNKDLSRKHTAGGGDARRWQNRYQAKSRLYTNLSSRLGALKMQMQQENRIFQKKIRLARKMMAHYKNKKATSLGKNRKLLLKNASKGDFVKNIKVLKQRIKILRSPLKPDEKLLSAALYQLGNSYYILNRNTDAIKAYENAILLQPGIRAYRIGASRSYNNRGVDNSKNQKSRQAIKDLDRAVELHPGSADAYYNRAVVYEKLRKIGQAFKDYTKAIELNPVFYFAYNNRGLIFYYANKFSHALSDLSRAISINPGKSLAYNNRGLVYAKTLHFDKAVRDYSRAIKLEPDWAWAYHNRGFAYAKMRQYDKAIADYSLTITLKPNYALAYINRATSYAYKRQYDNAIRDYSRAIRLDPDNPRVYYNRAVVYFELDKNRQVKTRVCRDLIKACGMAYTAACKIKAKLCMATAR